MSAGTVFAMAGDRIMMDYSSCLGPIDPQIIRDDKLVPALSYLVQFERMKRKAKLTAAELVLLDHLDLAELHSFEQAQELSNSLLKKWLATYKFKNWKTTETHKKKVTQKMRQKRALEIAKALADHERWHSHGRPLGMETLRNDLNLKIDDFGKDPKLETLIRSYHQLFSDYKFKVDAYHFTHTNGLLI